MTLQETFTTRLRCYRERNHISLDQLAGAMRIKREALEALEQNDLSRWPCGVYARAWIRAYACAVGLDPIDTVDEFCRLYPQGDRRAARTLQGMSAIVAQISEYRDEFSHGRDRRQTGSHPVPAASWQVALNLLRSALAAWLAALRPALTPRLKRHPGVTS